MPRPNSYRQLVREAVRQTQMLRPVARQDPPMTDSEAAGSSGHVDSDTYQWRPAGISSVTSTADPFYSAAG